MAATRKKPGPKTREVPHADFIIACTRAGLTVDRFAGADRCLSRPRFLVWFILSREFDCAASSIARKCGWDVSVVRRGIALAAEALASGEDINAWARRDDDAWVRRIVASEPGGFTERIQAAWRAGARVSAISRATGHNRYQVRKHLPGRAA